MYDLMDDIKENPLEKIRVECALKSEYMKMEYRNSHCPNDINILDYTVIAALEKQVPIEPVETVDKDLSDIWYTCPKCHGDLTHIRSSYCVFCGQKLKWNDDLN